MQLQKFEAVGRTFIDYFPPDLQALRKLRDSGTCHMVIVSDGNSEFIRTILEHHNLLVGSSFPLGSDTRIQLGLLSSSPKQMKTQ